MKEYPSRACRSCGAPIIFAQTDGGKTIPVDAAPQKRVVLRPVDLPNEPPVAQVVDTYVSHFATCPNAAQHRKPKEGSEATK
jgi:hypothetical protein